MTFSDDPRIAVWEKEKARTDANEPPPNFENPPKRHHYVPQFYLERFAARSSPEAAARIKRMEVGHAPDSGIVIGVRDAAVETDFYTVEMDDPRRVAEAEHIIGVFETAAGYAFANLDRAGPTQFPDDIDRENLSLYMALQFARVHDARDLQTQAYTKITSMVMRAAAQHPEIVRNTLARTGGEPTEEEVSETVDALREKWRTVTVTPHQNDLVATMLKTVPEFFRFFYLRRWAIARSPIPLLTSDRPIVLHEHPGSRQPWEGVGLMTADLIVFMLDRRRVLVMQHPEPGNLEGPCEIDARFAQALNALVANHARRWIFHHPDDSPLDGVPFNPNGR